MARITIASLSATIVALKADHERTITEQARIIKAQRETIDDLTEQVERLSAEVTDLGDYARELQAKAALAPAKPQRPAYVPPAPTAEQLAYRAAMAAARELAMRTGKSVRVGV